MGVDPWVFVVATLFFTIMGTATSMMAARIERAEWEMEMDREAWAARPSLREDLTRVAMLTQANLHTTAQSVADITDSATTVAKNFAEPCCSGKRGRHKGGCSEERRLEREFISGHAALVVQVARKGWSDDLNDLVTGMRDLVRIARLRGVA